MITSFTVKNYRLFDDLTINQLARLNLITGKNNVGKTTLLEALWLYCGATNPQLSVGVNVFRGVEAFRLSSTSIWDNLFRNFDTQLEITINAMIGEEQGHKLKISSQELDETRIPVDNGVAISSVTGRQSSFPQIKYQAELPDGEILTQYGRIEQDTLLFDGPGKALINSIFLSARNRLNPKELGARYDDILRTLKEDYILKGIQVIEPRIRDIQMTLQGDAPSFQSRVNIPGLETRRLPINYLGSGLFRYFEILSSIVVLQDGILLIDEIENGLHHSTLGRVWKAIAELAMQFNVQVFATTHSFECIKAAHETFSNEPTALFRLHRLEDRGQGIEVVSYSDDALQGAIDYEIEVR